ncbi:MAG: hypothetical protein MN733_29105 [Nitrososphaera sp.]|nr:hypothetical protein [Nitrososphaera sp.]
MLKNDYRKAIIIAVLLLIALCILAALYAYYMFDLITVNRDSILVSFYSSFVEDIIFFALIGIALFVWQTRDPRKASLDERIEYLYPGSHIPRDVINYNRTEIQRIGGYCSNAHMFVNIVGVDKTKDAVKITSDRQIYIHNILPRENYDDFARFYLEADPIPGVDLLGQVHKLEWRPDDAPPQSFIEDTQDLNESNNFQRYITLKLPPNKEGVLEVAYWVWCLCREAQIANAMRFIREYCLEIQNMTDSKVGVTILIRRPTTEGEEARVLRRANLKFREKHSEIIRDFRPPDQIIVQYTIGGVAPEKASGAAAAATPEDELKATVDGTRKDESEAAPDAANENGE